MTNHKLINQFAWIADTKWEKRERGRENELVTTEKMINRSVSLGCHWQIIHALKNSRLSTEMKNFSIFKYYRYRSWLVRAILHFFCRVVHSNCAANNEFVRFLFEYVTQQFTLRCTHDRATHLLHKTLNLCTRSTGKCAHIPTLALASAHPKSVISCELWILAQSNAETAGDRQHKKWNKFSYFCVFLNDEVLDTISFHWTWSWIECGYAFRFVPCDCEIYRSEKINDRWNFSKLPYKIQAQTHTRSCWIDVSLRHAGNSGTTSRIRLCWKSTWKVEKKSETSYST